MRKILSYYVDAPKRLADEALKIGKKTAANQKFLARGKVYHVRYYGFWLEGVPVMVTVTVKRAKKTP